MKKFLASKWAKLGVAFSVGMGSLAALAPLASATPSETESKLETLSSSVASEGVKLILIVLTALVTLIAAVIIIPKAIGFIRRFI